MTQSQLEQTCSYWGLTQEERDAVNASSPEVDWMTFHMERRADGLWQFSIPEFMTTNELLLGGTERALDYHYSAISEVLPDEYSSMEVTISRIHTHNPTTVLTKLCSDPNDPKATYYRDNTSEIQCWICGWMSGILWDPTPDYLYISCELIS